MSVKHLPVPFQPGIFSRPSSIHLTVEQLPLKPRILSYPCWSYICDKSFLVPYESSFQGWYSFEIPFETITDSSFLTPPYRIKNDFIRLHWCNCSPPQSCSPFIPLWFPPEGLFPASVYPLKSRGFEIDLTFAVLSLFSFFKLSFPLFLLHLT